MGPLLFCNIPDLVPVGVSMKKIGLAIIGFLLELLGLGTKTLFQQAALKAAAVVVAVFSFAALYTAAYLIVSNFATTAKNELLAEISGSDLGGQVLGWLYCLAPSSYPLALGLIFGTIIQGTLVRFGWNVIKMRV